MRLDADILIIGGGMAGACMASLLAAQGKFSPGRIALIEPKLKLDSGAGKDVDLRVSAISRASERILRACGVWERIAAGRNAPYERMCVWDEAGKADGSGAIHFDCADIGQPNLGYIVENGLMQYALLERARELGVRLISGQLAALEVQEGGIVARLQDGSQLSARLVIAADGSDSPARRMMNINARGALYGQRAVVTHIRSSQSHQRTAWQRFLTTGPIALLPLLEGADDKRCSIVWSTSEAHARELMALPEAEFCKAVHRATDGAVGEVISCVRRADFPLRHAHAERYVGPRFALIGDAAHTVHPLAGQGVNLGFLDCAALAQVLNETVARRADGVEDIGELKMLRRYERWRKGENMLMLAALDGINRLFSNNSMPLGLLRRAGLTVANRLSPVKTRFMRRALGLAGDLPAAAAQ